MLRIVLFLSVLLVLTDSRQQNEACEICDCSVFGVVDCSNRNLREIPVDFNFTVTTLNMSSNLLQGFKNGIFKNMTTLKILDLYNNALKGENISGDAFEGLYNLTVLNISQNDQLPLTNASTPDELFSYTPLLQVLRMYGTTGTYNKSHGYPDKQLSKLKHLRELWIDGLIDMEFGPGFRNMTSLKILRLAGDFIDPSWRSHEFCSTNLMDGMLDNLVSITHLYIRKCGVKEINRNVFEKLANLEYLDLSGNNKLDMTQVFDSFCSLSNKTTTLILNNIVSNYRNTCGTVITEKMVKCLKYKSIRELQLIHNQIRYIKTKALHSLPKTLQIVKASKNEFYLGLYMFDVSYLTNLTSLDISYQFFTDETSIWHMEKRGIEKPLEARDGNVDGIYPKSNRISDLNMESKDKNVTHNSYKAGEVNNGRLQEGREFQSFVERLITSISYEVTDQHIVQQSKNKTGRLVCPQGSNDTYIPPGTVIANIPPNMEFIDISHSKHANPIFEMYFNESNTLRRIKASNSLLYCWEGPVHGLNRLETLDLSVNICNKVSDHFFQNLFSLKNLNISYNFLCGYIAHDLHGQILSDLTALESLDISFNRLSSIPKLFLRSQSKLKRLQLRGNLLEDFTVDTNHMTQLQLIDLSNNRFNWLSESTCNDLGRIALITRENTNRSLTINLKKNRIHCSCKNLEFVKWVYDHFRSNTSLVVKISYCEYYENGTNIYFKSRERLGHMVAHLERNCRSYFAIIAVVIVALVLTVNIILGVLVHRSRWKILYWYYVVLSKNRKKENRNDYEALESSEYLYDVFVASTEDKKDFVIDQLRPKLKEMELKAFIAVYDINSNQNLFKVIGKSIHASKVVLFVFTGERSSDRYIKIAVHMWQCEILNRRRPKALVIFLEQMTGTDNENLREVCCQTFIDYPGDSDAAVAFWNDFDHIINELLRGA